MAEALFPLPPATRKEPPKPSFHAVKPPEGRGYYAALDLEFSCTQTGTPQEAGWGGGCSGGCACGADTFAPACRTEIQKRYKKLALQYHPDKAGAGR